MGAIEEAEEEEVHRQFETNVFGTLAVIQAMLPQMREQRQGHILTISSMTGFAGVPGYGYYSATKFALEGLLEALAQEVAPLGIRVTIVEPGFFHTSFNERSTIKTKCEIDDYAALNQRMQARMARVSDRSIAGDPERAAQIMIAAVEADQPPLHLVLGADALAFIRQKLVSVARELDAWEQMSRETTFIDVR
jgi:NAD(P)-dependent dehydrogenase (short-subunit alcohol dehydrogenase family)